MVLKPPAPLGSLSTKGFKASGGLILPKISVALDSWQRETLGSVFEGWQE